MMKNLQSYWIEMIKRFEQEKIQEKLWVVMEYGLLGAT